MKVTIGRTEIDKSEAWKHVFRQGFAPNLSTDAIVALRNALVEDYQTLVQGATTVPAPLACVYDWPTEAACAIGYCGWQGDGLNTVGEVEQFFARMCFEADQRLGEPAGCRFFLNWWDDSPREEARRLLLREVASILMERISLADKIAHDSDEAVNQIFQRDAVSHVTEEEWQAAIDADIANHAIRLAFADWLEDRGDPRAKGYKWMGERKVYPHPPIDNDPTTWISYYNWLSSPFSGYGDTKYCPIVGHYLYAKLARHPERFYHGVYETRQEAEEDLCRVISEESLAPSLTNPIS